MTGGKHFDPEYVKTLPDSYFSERVTYLNRVEHAEYMRRKNEASRELDRQAACVFGTRPVIDRSKLNCENVKGSPEYKARMLRLAELASKKNKKQKSGG
ncbi:MAG: hypothetical protein AAF364_18280 [Pseudomonadota bacterium]